MRKRAHLYIEGIVQGVFFRAFTRDVARRFALTGWVKNLPDGRVEAVFEGEEQDIQEAIKECYKGPPAAVVRHIDVKWEEPTGEFEDFEIRYY